MSRASSRPFEAAVSCFALALVLSPAPAAAQSGTALPELTVEGERAAPAARPAARRPAPSQQRRAEPRPRAAPAAARPAQAPAADPGAGPPIRATTAGPVRGYRALTSRSVTRTDTPLEQVPQSIQVLPRQVLEDQGAVTLSESYRNVSGVQPLSPLSAGQGGPLVRGLPGERFVDGLPNFYDYGARDLTINVERIEVLKGPGSIFFQGGPNPIGGAVNVVSKMPTTNPFVTTGLTVGTYGLISPFFDINRPLDSNRMWLLRVTGQYERTGGEVDTLDRRTFSLNPTLTFDNRQGTVATLQGHVSQHRQQDYPGLPTIGTLDRSGGSIRRDLFAVSRDLPKSDSRLMSLTGRIEHTFDAVWSANAAARVSTARFREPAQLILGNVPPLPPATFGFFNAALDQDQTEVSGQANLVAKVDWGMTKNRFLFGLDYNRVKDDGIFVGELVGFVDFLNPIFPPYLRPPEGPFTTFQKPRNVYEQAGATVQWQSTIAERLHLLAALKLAHLDIRSRDIALLQDWKTTETRLLPRLGLAYDLLPGVTAFAGWSQGVRAVQFYTSATTNAAPKPEESEQVEGGLKLSLGAGLSGTLSAFQITRRNVPVTAVGFTQIQSGEQRSRGFEADLLWQPTAAWSVLGSYAFTDTEITKDRNPLLQGRDLFDIPRHAGRLWANYSFLDGPAKGLSLGAGFYASSSRRVDLGGPWRTPGYVTFDARIAYTVGAWTVSVVGKNLLDREYFVPYRYLSGRVAPADGRAFQATLSATF